MNDARKLIDLLDLQPHPEGGWYRETWRAKSVDSTRSSGTAIYYLLEGDDVNQWHRIDSTEIWHWYSGAPLTISVSSNGHDIETATLGPDILSAQRPQLIIQPGWWQSAKSMGEFSLVGCSVSPGFDYSKFELAPPGWEPGPRAKPDKPDVSQPPRVARK